MVSETGPLISVLMPTYNQARFISRAITGLQAQTVADWELIIVDDGSTDTTAETVRPFLADRRIRYHRLPHNRGLGAALNVALRLSRGRYIAYLPSDDVYYAQHLESLYGALQEPEVVLAYAGVRHHYNRFAPQAVDGYPLQLVQVMHRRTDDRWLERETVVTDDLHRLYWSALLQHGRTAGTGEITCEWVHHGQHQHHKLVQEPIGGINPYRQYYDVREPLRFHSTVGNRIDEVERYRAMRERPDTPRAEDGLTIVLVGELAYNAERVLALEERGHRLYGLWMPEPYWYNTVGPLPFGHVTDIPRSNWREALRMIRPDVLYGLLNWQAVPFVHEVLEANPGIPSIWHFKEGPFISIEQGQWEQLIDLYTRSDGQIYCSPEMREWFYSAEPGLRDSPSLILDGDLPKREWLSGSRSPRLSDDDGEIHTVVPGRPIGLHAHTVGELAAQGIHLHFYGDFTHGQWRDWIDRARGFAPSHLHLHPQVDQEDWVTEFSRYDAGWLHVFRSRNGGEIGRADWDDLNYPARMATLALAGLPMILGENTGSIVAVQSLALDLDIGVFIRNFDELGEKLRDRQRMDEIRANVWRQREQFTFDYHVDKLIAFFRQVIEGHARSNALIGGIDAGYTQLTGKRNTDSLSALNTSPSRKA